MRIPTMYETQDEFNLDINILGKMLQIPSQTIEELTETLKAEFRAKNPIPTLEQKRYELSRLVSDDYEITDESEPILSDNEDLVNLQIGFDDSELLPDLDIKPSQEVKVLFTYEKQVTTTMLEEYLNGDIHSFTGDLSNYGTLKTDERFTKTDEEIRMMSCTTDTFGSDGFDLDLETEEKTMRYQVETDEPIFQAETEDSFAEFKYTAEIEDESVSYKPENDEFEERSTLILEKNEVLNLTEILTEDEFDNDFGIYDLDEYDYQLQNSGGITFEEDEEEEDTESFEDGDLDSFDEEEDEDIDTDSFDGEDEEDTDIDSFYDEEDTDIDSFDEEEDEDIDTDSFDDEDEEDIGTDYFEDIDNTSDVVEEEEESFDEEINYFDDEETEESIQVNEMVDEELVGAFIEDTKPTPKQQIKSDTDRIIADIINNPNLTQEQKMSIISNIYSTDKPTTKSDFGNIPIQDTQKVEKKEEVSYSSVRDYVRKHPRCTLSDVLEHFSRSQVDKEIKTGKVIRRGNILHV